MPVTPKPATTTGITIQGSDHPLRAADPDVALPALFAPTPQAATRFIEFFTANIRNSNTRRAYLRAVTNFADWLQARSVGIALGQVGPVHIAAYIEQLRPTLIALGRSAPAADVGDAVVARLAEAERQHGEGMNSAELNRRFLDALPADATAPPGRVPSGRWWPPAEQAPRPAAQPR